MFAEVQTGAKKVPCVFDLTDKEEVEDLTDETIYESADLTDQLNEQSDVE